MSDIVNAIDALIEEQLSQGEPERGFDAGDPDFPICPHCDRDWHGFPLTERVAAMHRRGSFDEGYSVEADESPVLCPGSNFIGPVAASAVAERYTSCLDILDAILGEMGDHRSYTSCCCVRCMVFDLSYDIDTDTAVVTTSDQ